MLRKTNEGGGERWEARTSRLSMRAALRARVPGACTSRVRRCCPARSSVRALRVLLEQVGHLRGPYEVLHQRLIFRNGI